MCIRDSNNNSWDQGGVAADQRRAARTGMGFMLLSAGVPMFTGGDEALRTQFGNNNAYNLDSPANWLYCCLLYTSTVSVATLQSTYGITGPVYSGYRAWGPNWTYSSSWTKGSGTGFVTDIDASGNRFNPNKLLLDPYAREMSQDPNTSTCTDGTIYASGATHRNKAVSYTHLDVYKRQGAVWVDEGCRGRFGLR